MWEDEVGVVESLRYNLIDVFTLSAIAKLPDIASKHNLTKKVIWEIYNTPSGKKIPKEMYASIYLKIERVLRSFVKIGFVEEGKNPTSASLYGPLNVKTFSLTNSGQLFLQQTIDEFERLAKTLKV